jgi:hypothetical protein
VTLTLVEFPAVDTHTLQPVIADASGNIVSTEFVPDWDDVGIRFFLTASGAQSQAQTSFTDAAKFWAGCIDTSWSTAGNWSTSATATCTGPGGAATSPTPAAGSSDSATITGGRTFYPNITSAITVQSIAVNAGASVTVSSAALTLNTDTGVSNTGLFTVSGTGTLAGARNFTNNAGGRASFSSSGTSTIRILTNNSTVTSPDGVVILGRHGHRGQPGRR